MMDCDMVRLREQRESAEDALRTTITEEQRNRLTELIKLIDDEIRRSSRMFFSELLHDPSSK